MRAGLNISPALRRGAPPVEAVRIVPLGGLCNDQGTKRGLAMNVFSRLSFRYFALLLTAICMAGSAGTAFATADPDSVSFTLQGCRNDGTILLPNGAGKFICPDDAYTTGNLGKNWA